MSGSVQAVPATTVLPDPYPGIEPYSYQDRDVFFGREAELRDLIRVVVMYRGVLLFSESGGGKSSLINAGLVPLAMEEGYHPEKIRVQPKKGKEIVIERIIEKTNNGVHQLPSVFPFEAEAERLILSVKEFLKVLQSNTACHPLLIFDQFEEWITLFDENTCGETTADLQNMQDQICEAMITLLRSTLLRVKLVISFREDYLAKLAPLFQQYPSLTDHYLRLTSPKVTQIAGLIRKPFETHRQRYPREINSELAQDIQKEFEAKNSSGTVHLTEVQIVCQCLFESGKNTEELHDYFHEQKKVEGVLIHYMEQALQSLSEELRGPAVCLLGRMVTASGTRNVIQEDDLLTRVEREQSIPVDVLKEALQDLERNTKLVRREQRQSVYYYEIASEFLIGWIQSKFQERQQRVAQEKKKQEQRTKQKAKRRQLIIPALAIAVVALVVFAGVSWKLLRVRSRQAREAESRRLAVFAHDVVDADPELGILLALQAAKQMNDEDDGVTIEAENALREASQKSRLQLVLPGHSAGVKDLVFSPDGSRLASASDDGTARIWDVTKGTLLFTLAGHNEGIFDLAFDPKGKLLATASYDHTIMIWDSSSGKMLLPVHFESQGSDLAFSEDGTDIALAMENGTIKSWSVDTGRPSRLSLNQITRNVSTSFSPFLRLDGNSSRGETLIVRDMISDKLKPALHAARPEIAITESPDGKQIATADRDGTVKLWDAESGNQLFSLPGQQGIITRLLFTPDGSALATASLDGSLSVWDLSSRRRLYGIHGDRSPLVAIAFSQDGAHLATASKRDYLVKLWDASSKRDSYLLLSSPVPTANFTFSPDGNQLAGIDSDRMLTLWDSLTGRVLHVLGNDLLRGSLIVFSRDGKYLAVACRDGTLSVWDLNSRTKLFRSQAHAGPVKAVVFNDNGTQVITAGADNTLKAWQTSSGVQIHSFPLKLNATSRLVLGPDGVHVAIIDGNRNLGMMDAASGKNLYVLPSQQNGIAIMSFDSSGKRFATWDAERGARLWETHTGRLLNSLAATPGGVNHLAFTADDRELIAYISSGDIRVWNTGSGRLVHLVSHQSDDYIVSVSSNQTQLLTVTYRVSRLSPTSHADYRFEVNTYPLAVKKLMEIAQNRMTRSISSQECRDYYLSGPQCQAAGLVEDGNRLAQTGDVNRASKIYEKAKHFDRNIKFDSGTEAKRIAARAKIDQGDTLLVQFAVLDAFNAYQKALELNPQASISPFSWNSVCWFGSLDGHAKEVMPACEHAVKLAPTNTSFRDSRGLAKALSGNPQGAIEDFREFIKQPLNSSVPLVPQRRQWVSELQAGRNPFTPELLKLLRSE